MLTGVISTTRNVKIQLEAVARAAARVRMARGAYSAGTVKVSTVTIRTGPGVPTQPRDSKKADGKEEVEEKEHDRSDDSSGFASIGHRACENRHTCTLTGGRKEHELPPTQAIDNPDGDQGGQKVSHTIESRQKEGGVVWKSDGLLEDDRRILDLVSLGGYIIEVGHARM